MRSLRPITSVVEVGRTGGQDVGYRGQTTQFTCNHSQQQHFPPSSHQHCCCDSLYRTFSWRVTHKRPQNSSHMLVFYVWVFKIAKKKKKYINKTAALADPSVVMCPDHSRCSLKTDTRYALNIHRKHQQIRCNLRLS